MGGQWVFAATKAGSAVCWPDPAVPMRVACPWYQPAMGGVSVGQYHSGSGQRPPVLPLQLPDRHSGDVPSWQQVNGLPVPTA